MDDKKLNNSVTNPARKLNQSNISNPKVYLCEALVFPIASETANSRLSVKASRAEFMM